MSGFGEHTSEVLSTQQRDMLKVPKQLFSLYIITFLQKPKIPLSFHAAFLYLLQSSAMFVVTEPGVSSQNQLQSTGLWA